MHPTKTNFPPADIGAPVGVSSDIGPALAAAGSILCAVHEVSTSNALQPEVRLIGAQALLDDHPAEAVVVQEIHRRYAAGASPRAIAAELNARGVPGPSGKMCNASALNGNAERGNGILHNELYRGVLVFGRQIWVKDRKTGRRRARTGAVQEIIRTMCPNYGSCPKSCGNGFANPMRRTSSARKRPRRSPRCAPGIC